MAAVFSIDEGNRVKEGAVVLGALAPHPFRAPSVENIFLGRAPTPALVEAAMEEVAMEEVARVTAITLDGRVSAPYKREAVLGVAWEVFTHCFDWLK